MDKDDKRELLAKEYLHLQTTIESFDSRALTVKAWSVTAGLTGLGAGFSTHSETLFLVAAFSSALFWLLETSWKIFQLAYYARNEALEAFFAGERSEIVPFQLGRAWFASFHSEGKARFWRVLWWPHVFTPHLFVVFGGLVLYALTQGGVISFAER